jgi:hypothetical protein
MAVKRKRKGMDGGLVHVTVAKGLSKKDGIAAVWKAAKRKGKTDCRSIGYDPKTGNGHAI